jgi:hypothetical protein
MGESSGRALHLLRRSIAGLVIVVSSLSLVTICMFGKVGLWYNLLLQLPKNIFRIQQSSYAAFMSATSCA